MVSSLFFRLFSSKNTAKHDLDELFPLTTPQTVQLQLVQELDREGLTVKPVETNQTRPPWISEQRSLGYTVIHRGGHGKYVNLNGGFKENS